MRSTDDAPVGARAQAEMALAENLQLEGVPVVNHAAVVADRLRLAARLLMILVAFFTIIILTVSVSNPSKNLNWAWASFDPITEVPSEGVWVGLLVATLCFSEGSLYVCMTTSIDTITNMLSQGLPTYHPSCTNAAGRAVTAMLSLSVVALAVPIYILSDMRFLKPIKRFHPTLHSCTPPPWTSLAAACLSLIFHLVGMATWGGTCGKEMASGQGALDLVNEQITQNVIHGHAGGALIWELVDIGLLIIAVLLLHLSQRFAKRAAASPSDVPLSPVAALNLSPPSDV